MLFDNALVAVDDSAAGDIIGDVVYVDSGVDELLIWCVWLLRFGAVSDGLID